MNQLNQWDKSTCCKLTVKKKWFFKRRMQISVKYYWQINSSMMILSIKSFFQIAKVIQVKIKKALKARWLQFFKTKGLLNRIIISIKLMLRDRKIFKNHKDAFLMKTLKITKINYWIETKKKGTFLIIIKKNNCWRNLILRACWVKKIILWVYVKMLIWIKILIFRKIKLIDSKIFQQ